MDYIDKNELFEYFIETINSCGLFLLSETDEQIEYNIFEIFDINVHTFLYVDNINVLLSSGLISKSVYHKAELIREMYLKIENTDDWTVEGVRNSLLWKDIMILCDNIREEIK